MRKTLVRNAWLPVVLCAACGAFPGGCGRAGGAETSVSMPMPIDRRETADARWRAKPVLESRLLDDMEDAATWSHRGSGRMTFTTERQRSGTQAVRLESPTIPEKPNTSAGRPFGEGALVWKVGGEDWTAWNRLSVWVYPHAPGFHAVSLLVKFHNDGAEKLPGSQTRGALMYVLVVPGEWNHVALEIPHLTRDKVTAVEFIYRLQGHEAGAAETVRLDFDRLELQKVEEDHWEGWNVAPGRIAFCHTGYRPGASKTALATGLAAARFEVVDPQTGKTVLEKAVRTVEGPVGRMQVLDFSEVREPGTYVLRAGDVRTREFRIGHDVWKRTIWKTINLFYCERCGWDVPGVHKVCHADWQGVHGDRKIVINGGWHDAGDLSQGLVNTSEAAYAMMSLAAQVAAEDPALSGRLMDEARWGLDWMLKTRFDGGFRMNWATMDYWTDGVVGTADDTFAKAGDSPFENFLATAAEALAARLLKRTDAALAARCLAAAREDWRFACEKTKNPHLELAAAGALASLEVFRATGDRACADKAVELADVILACQQREVTDWDVPMVGFYYTGPDRRGILHYFHRGHEQGPTVALAELCATFPDHPDWMKWYSAVVLHSEYLKALAAFTAPYRMLPASVYRLEETGDAFYRRQIEQGVRVAEGHYLRRFPIWGDFRGNHGTILSQTKAASAAAVLRRDAALADLCQAQLEWVVGRNPFAQSTMYGEGYDFAPQYSAMSGDMVGSLPVGIQTRLEKDVPYWPTANCYNYKEVWVHPSSRWLWILGDLANPACAGSERRGDGEGVTLKADEETGDGGRVTVRVTATGQGRVRLALRTHNLEMDQGEQTVELKAGKPATVTWAGRVTRAKEPWVAVVVPNGNLAERREVVGGLPQRLAAR